MMVCLCDFVVKVWYGKKEKPRFYLGFLFHGGDAEI